MSSFSHHANLPTDNLLKIWGSFVFFKFYQLIHLFSYYYSFVYWLWIGDDIECQVLLVITCKGEEAKTANDTRDETEEIKNNNFSYKILEEARVGGIQ